MESLVKLIASVLAITIVLSVVGFGGIGYWVSQQFNLHPLACMLGFGVLGIPFGILLVKLLSRN
jgi:H+/Cl- antiporter ClcA